MQETVVLHLVAGKLSPREELLYMFERVTHATQELPFFEK